MSAPIHRNRIERNHLFWKQWQKPEQRGGELKSECEAADQTKRQKRDQASRDKASAVVSSQFRHCRPVPYANLPEAKHRA